MNDLKASNSSWLSMRVPRIPSSSLEKLPPMIRSRLEQVYPSRWSHVASYVLLTCIVVNCKNFIGSGSINELNSFLAQDLGNNASPSRLHNFFSTDGAEAMVGGDGWIKTGYHYLVT
jgi:hypothetical protein